MVETPKPKPSPASAGTALIRKVGSSATTRRSSRVAMKPATPPPPFMWMPSGCSSPTTMSAP